MKHPPLNLSITAQTYRAAVPFLKRYVPRAVELAGSPLRELSIVVAPDALMKRLHRQFFNDPTMTDVITFPLELDKRGRALSGEVYLGLSVARRQAALRRIRLQDELLLYAVHGILHLSGYDDLTPREYAAMHREEDRILEALGLGPVFGRPEQQTRPRARAPRPRASRKPHARATRATRAGKAGRTAARKAAK